MKDSVSIAMTTFNGERFLRKQLDSIYSQTRLPNEVIVCDDCSTDGTVAILEEYKINKGLTYFVNESQLGVNANFFKAISLCQGDYIAICDQDDIWLPEKIELSLKKLKQIEKDSFALVYSSKVDIDAEGNLISKISASDKDYCGNVRSFFSPNPVCQGCSMLLNRKLVDYVLSKYQSLKFSHTYLIYDAFICFTCVMIGQKCDMDKQLLLYRRHDNNVLGRRKKNLSFREKLAQQNKYRYFTPDSRFLLIDRTYQIVKEDIMNDNVHKLVSKMYTIRRSRSIIRGLLLIMSIRELPFPQKVKIVLGTISVKCLKMCCKLDS